MFICPLLCLKSLHKRERRLSKSSSWLPKGWFRPVVATFTAVGIGEDTADLSYRERGVGLSGGDERQKLLFEKQKK